MGDWQSSIFGRNIFIIMCCASGPGVGSIQKIAQGVIIVHERVGLIK